MEPIALIVGIGISAFLLLYFIFNMQKEHQDSPWHIALRLLIIFFFIIHLILLAKAIIDNTDNCEIVLNETRESYVYGNNFTGYHWDYEYSPLPGVAGDAYLFHINTTRTYAQVCFEDTTQTTTLFYKTILWLWRLLAGFIGMYLVWELFLFIGRSIKK